MAVHLIIVSSKLDTAYHDDILCALRSFTCLVLMWIELAQLECFTVRSLSTNCFIWCFSTDMVARKYWGAWWNGRHAQWVWGNEACPQGDSQGDVCQCHSTHTIDDCHDDHGGPAAVWNQCCKCVTNLVTWFLNAFLEKECVCQLMTNYVPIARWILKLLKVVWL